MKSKITVSVIVCTYNGEKKIKACLESLMCQTYPKNKYEIIVVDDGSTDDTYDIASRYPVKVIRHEKNKGLSAARNAGLKIAQGKIYACFDDDCIADKNWLTQLSKAYENKLVMGVGGLITLPKNSSLTDEYCFCCGYGSPVPITLGHSKSIFIRLLDYLITNFSHPQSKYTDGTKVLELPGILSSFRKDKLLEIGGWNETFTNIAEDIDLCRRLKQITPNSYFVVMPSAKVVHDQKLSFFEFLKKEFQRGKLRKHYYLIKGETPPYFPFPFIYTFLLLSIIALGLPIYLVLFLPFLLYSWWIIRVISERKINMFIFPYMQLLHEGFTILGML